VKIPKDKEVDGKPSYVVLNDPRAGEVEIEEEVERVAKGLFSVVVTMGEISKAFFGSELMSVRLGTDYKMSERECSGDGGSATG